MRHVLLAFLLFIAPSARAAESYFGIGGGISYAPDLSLDGVDADLDFDIGFRIGTLTYGRVFDNGWSCSRWKDPTGATSSKSSVPDNRPGSS